MTKTKITLLMVLTSFLAIPTSFAETTKGDATSLKGHLSSYVEIQEALANDNLERAKLAAQKLTKESQNVKSISLASQRVAQANTLEDSRKGFKELSQPFTDWVSKNKPTDFEVIYCPMAGAKWVQKKGDQIKNPYFGKEMLSCGEKTS